jgi:peptide methionine sulfoxide reductase MsrB
MLSTIVCLGQFSAADGVNQMQRRYSASGYDITPLSREEVRQLTAKLDPETYRITQKSGTEPAFCGTLLDNKQEGTYCCAVCGLPLFSSAHKFTSGTGWPSFYREFDPHHVSRKDGSQRRHGADRNQLRPVRRPSRTCF